MTAPFPPRAFLRSTPLRRTLPVAFPRHWRRLARLAGLALAGIGIVGLLLIVLWFVVIAAAVSQGAISTAP